MKRRRARFSLLLLLSIVLLPAARVMANDESKSFDENSRSSSSSKQSVVKQKAKDESTGKQYRDGEEWFGRAYELHQSDRFQEAIEAFKRSIELGYRPATAMYNVACGYAMLTDKENALIWLQRALDHGFDRAELLSSDSDLDPLRSDARFKSILASTSRDRDESWKAKAYKKPDRLEQANMEFDRLERGASQEGGQWYKTGSMLLRLRELDRSITALGKAVIYLDYEGASAMYNLACAHALRGDLQVALDWLERSINTGFDDNDKIENDPDIMSLRSDPRFKRIERLSRVLSLSQFNKGSYGGSDYSKQRWAPAVELYESLVKSEPDNGRAWFNLGYSLHYSREHTRAIESFEKAIQFGYRKPTSMYNIACGYSMLDQRDMAFQWLDRAVEAGFNTDNYIESDRDLDNLRSDPRFRRFQIRAKGL